MHAANGLLQALKWTWRIKINQPCTPRASGKETDLREARFEVGHLIVHPVKRATSGSRENHIQFALNTMFSDTWLRSDISRW